MQYLALAIVLAGATSAGCVIAQEPGGNPFVEADAEQGVEPRNEDPQNDAQEDAAEEPPEELPLAAMVRVQLPIKNTDDQSLQQTLRRAQEKLVRRAQARGEASRPTLVLVFSADAGAATEDSQFERALSLARFLTSRDFADVKTIAFVPKTLRGHGVLVAIACEELAMAADAEIGEATRDELNDSGPTVLAAYQEIANRRRTIPLSVVTSMVSPDAEVLLVESDEGTRFLLQDDLPAYRKLHDVIEETKLVDRGSLGQFTGREGRKYGFVKVLAEDRPALARSLGFPESALDEDESLKAHWQPIFLELRGPITPSRASQLDTLLGQELARGVNWIGIRIDSAGGDLAASMRIANLLGQLDGSVHTVAYVPAEARGGAAIVALACDRLIMQPEAILGTAPLQPGPPADAPPPPPRGGPRLLPPPPRPEDDNAESLAAALVSVRELARRRQQPWSLMAAMIDPAVDVFTYNNKGTGQQLLMSREEVEQRADSNEWQRGQPLNDPQKLLELTAGDAQAADISDHTVDSFDQLCDLYGFEQRPEVVDVNWALQFVEALATPGLSVLVLMVGFVGLYVELKTPGVGVGAFVAAVAFLLFFWSKTLDQTAGWLEALLFIAGLFFILLEIFVLPGFGIFGLGGGAMVLLSLILASQTFVIPRTELQLVELRKSMSVVVAATIGVIAVAMTVRRYLPNAPIFNRVLLEPPLPEEQIEIEQREALADYSHLVGRGGTATTDLRPTGKALIDDELVDVVAAGMPLDKGTSVVVIQAHANRVVVDAVS